MQQAGRQSRQADGDCMWWLLTLPQARPNARAVLLTVDITTPAFYRGTDLHCQVTNMICEYLVPTAMVRC